MMRRVLATLLAVCLLAAMLPVAAIAEEDTELFFTKNEDIQVKDDADKSEIDHLKDLGAALTEALGNKDWNALADAVKLSGDWRNDLINLAESQLGYREDKDGMTIYTQWAGKKEAADWSAMFISWIAEKAGLSTRHFPQADDVKTLRARMGDLHAVKDITRANYPTYGDLAIIEKDGKTLIGVVVYVSNGYASVIHGGDGRVTKETYQVDGREFRKYIDLNELMQRAGIEVGKGGVVPEIPEGGIAGWTNANAVYLRSEPTTACKSLTTVKKSGTALLVTGAAMQEDGYIWYAVEYKQYKGYIRGDLINLDKAALPTPTPTPAPAPEVTDQPACSICSVNSMGLALPVDCCYDHLSSMPLSDAGRFIAQLLKDDPSTFVLFLSCVSAHVYAGDDAILCLGNPCGVAAWSLPGPAHLDNCPWHLDGLNAQERVVNLEIREARTGQELMLYHEIYGARSYQWFEVAYKDGQTSDVDGVLIPAANSASLIAKAGESLIPDNANPGDYYSYYSIATILIMGTEIQIRSRETVVALNDAPVAASALLGEEINFTYVFDGADAYQWYIQKGETLEQIEGETASTLTFKATLEDNDAIYYAVALAANQKELGRSGKFSYHVELLMETPDATACENSVLCKYFLELTQMTREERYVVLTETWYTPEGETTGVSDQMDMLVSYILLHWHACHQSDYPDLLCTCGPSEEGYLVKHPYLVEHEDTCSWYIAPTTDENGKETIVTRPDQPEFDKWVLTASPQMRARAALVPSLDHVVLEKNAQNPSTYDVYIVRYADPVGTVNPDGFLTYKGLTIAWINFSSGQVFSINALPADAPALASF